MVLFKCYCHNINVYVVPVFTVCYTCIVPIPVAVWSVAWVCGHWLAGIVGLNLVWGMDVCFLCALCLVR